jgi:8-oxo-dGTP pyrophosphatase MutT (NUDIX family)
MDNNKILAIKRIKKDEVYYVFPGGGVEEGEELEEALKRECREELGVEIKIIKNFASERFNRGNMKQMEYFYICKIISGEIGTGNGPEYDVNSNYEGIHGIEWISDKFQDYDLRPENISSKLFNYFKNDKRYKD